MLLEVKNLSVDIPKLPGSPVIVRNISFTVEKEKIFALVGGSGSGKTTTGLALMRLLSPDLRILTGEIRLNGENLLEAADGRMRQIRGQEIGMVFQEPLYAFNPVFPIKYQIEEVLRFHTKLSGSRRRDRAMDLLKDVGISAPDRVGRQYPHQLSGGMRQRAMIAQAIAANPKLLIADEPTSNLDVTLQAKIIELFQSLRREKNLSILLITHDLGVVEHLSDEVGVMRQGAIIESGRTKDLMDNPREEYTQSLMEAIRI